MDGELTGDSTLLLYTPQAVYPAYFETEDSPHRLWSGPHRLFFFTYQPEHRIPDLARFGTVHVLASSGGKSVHQSALILGCSARNLQAPSSNRLEGAPPCSRSGMTK